MRSEDTIRARVAELRLELGQAEKRAKRAGTAELRDACHRNITVIDSQLVELEWVLGQWGDDEAIDQAMYQGAAEGDLLREGGVK